jgi:hypothetical protein
MLKAMLEATSKCSSRTKLCGICIKRTKKHNYAIATDGHILLKIKGRRFEKLEEEVYYTHGIKIPKSNCLLFLDKKIRGCAGYKIIEIGVKYPDTNKVIPKTFKNPSDEMPFFTTNINKRVLKILGDTTGYKQKNIEYYYPDYWNSKATAAVINKCNNYPIKDFLLLVMPLRVMPDMKTDQGTKLKDIF